jgi:ADP-ribose pyrophosphatase
VAFRKLEETLLHQAHSISLVEAEIEGPDGRRFRRDIVHHSGAVSVVPLLEDGRVVMVRQYRSALETEILEIPAGKRDVDGEPPHETARRELVEEVGYDSDHLELLAEFYNSPGFCDEHSYTYLATSLRAVERAPVDHEEEAMEIVHITLDDVPRLITSRELIDAKSIIGLLLARERLAAR